MRVMVVVIVPGEHQTNKLRDRQRRVKPEIAIDEIGFANERPTSAVTLTVSRSRNIMKRVLIPTRNEDTLAARSVILGGIIAAAAIVLPSAWQAGSSELANIELRDDIQDIASQISSRIGFSATRSDEDRATKFSRSRER